jgi:aminopeptidase N
MKSHLITILCLLTISATAQRNFDVLHYKFQLTLNESDTIYGVTQIKAVCLNPDSIFCFQLTPVDTSGRGMHLDAMSSFSGIPFKNYQRVGDTIKLRPGGLINANDTFFISIAYHGIPRDGLIISKNNYGDKTFFGDNWPDRAHNWLPCIDDPGDKASVDFSLFTPPDYKVIANGHYLKGIIVTSGQQFTVWQEAIPLPTKVMVIGVAKFAVREYPDSPNGIPVSAWVYHQDAERGFQSYSPAPSIVKFFSNYIGPFPYKKLANVQSKTRFGGMENASCIFYYEESALSSRSLEDLLAHEIAHQWFGDMVTEKSFSHLWLSEGFATYLTDIYLESVYGTEGMNNRMTRERQMVIVFKNGRPVVDSMSHPNDLLNANSYQKGGWILHMLRREVGDSAFHRIIREFYDRYKGSNADSEDFEKVVEELTQKDFSKFFHQWLYTPGIPILDVSWKYNTKLATISVTVEQKQKQLFEFPLEIAIQTKTSKERTIALDVTKKTQTFNYTVADKQVSITLDPSTSLLFDGKVRKVSPVSIKK